MSNTLNTSKRYDDPSKKSYYYSEGIQIFGIGEIMDCMEKMMQTTSLPIVSVGSGNGIFESKLKKKYPNIEFILVDPLETIYIEPDPVENRISVPLPSLSGVETSQEFILDPNYDYVDDLVKARPGIVGKCNLLLNWPEPNDSTDRSSYDYAALQKLVPQNVFTICETTGISGSSKFLDWLHKSGIKCNDLEHEIDYEAYSTQVIHCIKGTDLLNWPTEHTIAWLSKINK